MRKAARWGLVAAALLLVGIVAVGCFVLQPTHQPPPSQTSEHVSADRQYVYGGLPKSADQSIHVLRNKGYIAGYSEKHKDPAWVAYRLFRVENPPAIPRPEKFAVDNRTEAKVEPGNYTRTGYDRGHMAPNRAIATRYGAEAQLETFLMSNICPQKPSLNRQVWEHLEDIEVNDYANRLEEVWVVDGPIFGENGGKLPGGVDVPVSFFKIIVDEADGRPRMLAFIMPQEVKGSEAPRQFLTSVKRIEEETGLDFFTELDHDTETKLEAETAPDLW